MTTRSAVRSLLLVLPLIGAAAPAGVGAATPDGPALFKEKCLMCHGKAGMGTALLSRRVQPGELLLRKDLVAAFVVRAARIGLGNMPAITRGEVSDAQLDAIAAYLAANSAGHP
jgi:mono/diheme cytochrome c family protein